MKLAPVLCAAAALGLTGCGSTRAPVCVTVPQTIPNASLITSGTKLTVRAGAIVYAVLVEAASYTSAPGFPWLTPTSSDRTVLAPVRLCTRTGTSSLPLSVTAFHALQQGKVTLTAPLTPRWRLVKTKPHPFKASVTVQP